MTKRKVGYLNEEGQERYSYLRSLSGIPIKPETLETHKDIIEDFKEVGKGRYLIIPVGTTNIYEVSFLHELQNILGLHGYRDELL